jgi:aminomethyltransferase
VTSAFWSPKLESNIALAMLPIDWTEAGTELCVDLPGEADPQPAKVVPMPFFDPERTLSKAA